MVIGTLRQLQIRASRLRSGSATKSRDQGHFVLRTSFGRFSPYDVLVELALRLVWFPLLVGPRCRALSCWRPLALAVTRYLKVFGTHYVLQCEWVTYPPHSLYTLRSRFLSSLLVGRAVLPPLIPDASCSVAVSLSPWGATRSLGWWHVPPSPFPPAGCCPAGFKCQPLRSFLSLSFFASLLLDCWGCRP